MPSVGDVLAGRYRVEARLGSGGMATVFRARDLRLDRDVAVKVLLPNMALDPVVAARFDREARALAAAAHPSVVSVFDVEQGNPDTGSEPFYVMELCDGGSLAERLATDGRLPPPEVAAIIESVADGLADLHRRGVIHRDVKPHNILFSGGRAKLADFGLARGEEATDLTSAGTTIGHAGLAGAGAPRGQSCDTRERCLRPGGRRLPVPDRSIAGARWIGPRGRGVQCPTGTTRVGVRAGAGCGVRWAGGSRAVEGGGRSVVPASAGGWASRSGSATPRPGRRT